MKFTSISDVANRELEPGGTEGCRNVTMKNEHCFSTGGLVVHNVAAEQKCILILNHSGFYRLVRFQNQFL